MTTKTNKIDDKSCIIIDDARSSSKINAQATLNLYTKRYVDPNPSIIRMISERVYKRDYRSRRPLQPHRDYIRYMLPPSEYGDCPPAVMCTRYSHTSINKNRTPINVVSWTKDSRRVVTGAANGEFAVWDGTSFQFEILIPAHTRPIRSLTWSHDGRWLLSGDHDGVVKIWQSSLAPMHQIQAHTTNDGMATVRSITFAPGDQKFATCSDDKLIKVWDFWANRCERVFSGHTGHGWDVKSLRWHPTKPLLVSGSKDNTVKLWDAKNGTCLNTLYGHNHTVLRVDWAPNGNWFVSCGKDQMIKLYDIRTMREFQTWKGHDCEVTAVAWHPTNSRVLCTADMKGKIIYWSVGCDEPQAIVPFAHESAIWDVQFNPIGNVLASASGDTTTKFWCRPRPGDHKVEREHNMAALEQAEGIDLSRETTGQGFASLPASSASSVQAAAKAIIAAANAQRQSGQGSRYSGGSTNKQAPPPGYVCRLCNTPGHFINDCPQRAAPPPNYVCHGCGQSGHWKRDCPLAGGGGDKPY